MGRKWHGIPVFAFGSLAGLIAVAAVVSAALFAFEGRGGHRASAAAAPQQVIARAQAGGGAGSSAGTNQQQPQRQSRPYLGVEIDSSNNKATVKQVVSGSPADTAGIKAGDVITAIDGANVASFSDLTKALSAKQAGNQATLSLNTNGTAHNVTVTLGQQPQPSTGAQGQAQSANRGFLGVLVNNADAAAQQKYSLNTTNGALIVSVTSGGPADKAGLKVGDLITNVNGTAVNNVADLQKALQGTTAGSNATVQYQRAGASQTATVTLGSAPSGNGGTGRGAHANGGLGRLPLGGLISGNFSRFISASHTIKDANGNPQTMTIIGGTVASTATGSVTVTLNGGGSQTFTIDGNTKIMKGFRMQAQASDLAQNDQVFVTTSAAQGQTSTTAKAIIDVTGLGSGSGRPRTASAGPGSSNSDFGITTNNGGLQIRMPGGQSISLPLLGSGTGSGGSSAPSNVSSQTY